MSISELTTASGTVRWQIQAERLLRPEITSQQVIPLVVGKTAGRAASLLTETFGLKELPEISILPIWWPWLPLLPMQITVQG